MSSLPNNAVLLQQCTDDFVESTKLRPVMGVELEFYVKPECCGDVMQAFFTDLCVEYPLLDCLESEEGLRQYELVTKPNKDLVNIAETVLACQQRMPLVDHAKPYKNQPGCGMHVHLHLENEAGFNVFQKPDSNSDEESKLLYYVVSGLLEALSDSLAVFLPDNACRQRLVDPCMHTPTTMSWGGNNRTVALRLPTTTTEPHKRRIEHRVPSAFADPFLVIIEILKGAKNGLQNASLPKQQKYYGDAKADGALELLSFD